MGSLGFAAAASSTFNQIVRGASRPVALLRWMVRPWSAPSRAARLARMRMPSVGCPSQALLRARLMPLSAGPP